MNQSRLRRSTVNVVFLGVIALSLAACSTTQKAASMAPVFFPPLPDEPRVQYLTSFNSSGFLQKEKTSFRIFVTGEQKIEADITIDKPLGIAVHNGVIYVCDMHQGTVFIIDAEAKRFESLPGNAGPGKLKKPAHVAVDQDGTIYVSDVARKEIMIYNAAGKFIRAVGRNMDMKPFATALSPEHLYILDGVNNVVKVLDKATFSLIREIGAGTTIDDTIWRPFNLTRDSQGNLYVTNVGTCRVLKMDSDGHVLLSFGKQGDAPGMFARPRGVAVDDAGLIWVVDAAFQNVQIFNETGRILLSIGDVGLKSGSMNLPAGIAITKDRMDFFRKFASPDFDVEELIFVTNQSGYDMVAVYALGRLKEGSTLRTSVEAVKPAEPAKPLVSPVPSVESLPAKPDKSVKPDKSTKPAKPAKPDNTNDMDGQTDKEKPDAPAK